MTQQDTLGTIWEVPDELWEIIEPIILEGRPTQDQGPQACVSPTDAQRHHLPVAQRVSMEPVAERAWGRQHHPSYLSTVGRTGGLAPNVGSPGGGMRRVGRRRLGMAVGGRSHGQGTFGGDLIGRNPTDRGKAGSKRSLLVDEKGGPLSIVVAGANVHDAKLLEGHWTPSWSNDRSPPRRNPNTCVWTKGMTILQAVGLPPDTAIGGTSGASARRSWTVLATSGIRRGGGLWNERWHGCPSAVRSWSATTRRRRTTLDCYNSHVRFCGSVVSGI